jgi:hemin uptake protein HemP
MITPNTTPNALELQRPAPVNSKEHLPLQNGSSWGQEPASCLTSDALLRGQKVVQIAHNGSLYKLQATKLGKLILTK